MKRIVCLHASLLVSTLVAAPSAAAQLDGLRAPEVAPSARTQVVLEGVVLGPGGAPVQGALVVSNVGGQAQTDRSGGYRLAVDVPVGTESLRVTAFGPGGGILSASASPVLVNSSGTAFAPPLQLARGGCEPSWLPTFGGMPGTNGFVWAMASFDDGSGPALYVGGAFTSAGGAVVNGLAKWDGTSWSAVSDQLTGSGVHALIVFDDGSGPALYVGGRYALQGNGATDVAKWDGTTWTPLGPLGRSVRALAVYDDGSGPALYAGGEFDISNGAAADHVAKWDGSSWSAVGSGTSDWVAALLVHDDGSGPALFAGGAFEHAGGTPANHIAKWDGASWSALGSGTGGTTIVHALAEFDDGLGAALFVGGSFQTAGGSSARRIARWDGSSWSALGTGFDSVVSALIVHDDGNGPALHAGGSFTTAGGSAAARIARWDGASWSALGAGVTGQVNAFGVFDEGNGPALVAGGNFLFAGGQAAIRVAKWENSSWSAFGGGLNNLVRAVAVFDDGDGPALYAGGEFTSAGGAAVARIAKWDGSSWSALGSGMNNTVWALTVHDDGGGPALYAGGSFTNAGGVPTSRIAKWNGTSWSALGSGVSSTVRAFAVYDDGSGPGLFVGGAFFSAGGVSANKLAKWNGSNWSALGSGVSEGSAVVALAVHDDGSGPALYAGGGFETASGVPGTLGIARWDGASWSSVGGGLEVLSNFEVMTLTVFDDGDGAALYAGGQFASIGGVTASSIAKWDGTSWAPLGIGVEDPQTTFGYPFVNVLSVFDDGSGPALYAAGDFAKAGGLAADMFARWDGASWGSMAGRLTGVTSMTVLDDGAGPELVLGGTNVAFAGGDSYLAKLAGCPDSAPPTLSTPTAVYAIERLGSAPGEVVHFTVTASDNMDPAPSLVCVPPSGSVFPQGTTLVTCTATDALGNQRVAQFPVIVQPRSRARGL